RSSPTRNHRVGALALALLLLVASLLGCSSGGASDGGRSTTTDRDAGEVPELGPTDGEDAETEPHSGSTIPGPPPAPDLWDVPDRAVPGLGDPRIDVHHYDVVLRADPGEEEIAGRARITLAARTTDPLPAFTLDLRGPTV